MAAALAIASGGRDQPAVSSAKSQEQSHAFSRKPGLLNLPDPQLNHARGRRIGSRQWQGRGYGLLPGWPAGDFRLTCVHLAGDRRQRTGLHDPDKGTKRFDNVHNLYSSVRITLNGAMAKRPYHSTEGHLSGLNQSITVDFDDGFGESSRCFLRQIMANAAFDDSVRVFARELLAIDAASRCGAPLASPSRVIVGTVMSGALRPAAFPDRHTSARRQPGRAASGNYGSRWRHGPGCRRMPRCDRTSHHRSSTSAKRSAR